MDKHELLRQIKRVLPTDYSDYGGEVVRWADEEKSYPDCSTGCRHAQKLPGALAGDWLVCCKPDGPRAGLLTFEHQAGFECFEQKDTLNRKGDDDR